MTDLLEKLLNAADNHGIDSDPDHTIGDLQDLLRKAWALLPPSGKLQLLRSDEASNVIDCGARDEFSAKDLEDAFSAEIARQEQLLALAGVTLMEAETGFYWESDSEMGEHCFEHRVDAVANAVKDLTPASAG